MMSPIRNDAAQAAPSTVPATSEIQRRAQRCMGSVLVVEDDGIAAIDIEQTLESNGYDVAGVATSAEEALALARTLRPDLVLMDIHLRGAMDGIETAQQLQRELALPVVYLTANADEVCLRRATETEPYGYILKPFESIDLRICVDVALRRSRTDRLRRDSDMRYRRIVQQTSEGVFSTNADQRITVVNAQFAAMLGYTSTELVGRSPFDFMDERDHQLGARSFARCRQERACRFEARLLRVDGAEFWASISLSSAADPAGEGMIGVVQDVSDKKASEEALRAALAHLKRENGALADLAIRDDLTGLYNRREFERRLDSCLEEQPGRDAALSVVLADIDHFKAINDTYGHHAGDEVLRELGGILGVSLRQTDLACRYGGEEFALLLPNTPGASAVALAERIRKNVAAHAFWVLDLTGERRNISVTLSLGCAVRQSSRCSGEDLLREADQALYSAKTAGRNRVVGIDPLPELAATSSGFPNPR
ncbi:MAG TPA: diguanylate cyclase [Polyangiaceae bacterium]|nr:diguanylate cyclase [Polyangiaceae bacterium]